MNRKARLAAAKQHTTRDREFAMAIRKLRVREGKAEKPTIHIINRWRVIITCDAPQIIGDNPPVFCKAHKHWCVALAPNPPESRPGPQGWEQFGIVTAALGVPEDAMLAGMKRALQTDDPVVHLTWVEPFGAQCEILRGLNGEAVKETEHGTVQPSP